MAAQMYEITVGEEAHPIVFSSNALARLEDKSGMSVQNLSLLLITRRAGFATMRKILWAALEGGRLRKKLKRSEWSLDEVGDLIDAVGGDAEVWDGEAKTNTPTHAVGKAVVDAWLSAFPKARPKTEDETVKTDENPTTAAS